MPRTLPWLAKPKSSTAATSSSASCTTPRTTSSHSTKRQRTSASGSASIDNERYNVLCRSSRTPSTSPPPILAPTEEPMQPGDEAWIMVEDEFYTTAQHFTSHLHQAEYVRLKRRVATKTLSSIEDIERPTDGRTALRKDTKVRDAQAAQRKGVNKALKGKGKLQLRRQNQDDYVDEEEEAEEALKEELKIKDKTLAGLMLGTGTSGKPMKRNLAEAFDVVLPNTRAAQGYGKQVAVQRTRDRTRLFDGPAAMAGTTMREADSHEPPSKASRSSLPQLSSVKIETDTDKPDTKTGQFKKPDEDVPPLNRRTYTPRRPLEPEPSDSFASIPTRSRPTVKVEDTPRNLPLPDFDDFPISRASASRRQTAPRPKEEEKKIKLEDIPTFLC